MMIFVLIFQVKALHEANIYIVLDINLVWTSDRHPWAAQWLENASGEHQYFYVNVSGDQINVSLLQYYSHY